MNSYNKTYLDQIAQEKGFVRDNLEKVIRLAEILRYINQSPLLQKSLVLKGGTAIILTLLFSECPACQLTLILILPKTVTGKR